MKKVFLFILSLSLLLPTFVGCGGNEDTSKLVSDTISETSSEGSTEESEDETVEREVVLRFVAMSDVHVSNVNDTYYQRFGKAMDNAYKYAEGEEYKNLDALLVAGDMTGVGYESEMKAFKQGVDQFVKEGTTVQLITGNHEFFYEEGNHVVERWETVMEQKANTHMVINGYHFIGVSLYGYTNYEPSIAWLEEELKKAAEDDPTKPIFVQQHYHITNTVYGSDLWGTDVFTSILNKYPQVIDFSGHSHYPINDPRSIWQGRFTALGCGTLAYFELEPGMVYGSIPPNASTAAQFYIVEVNNDNSVRIKLYDVITESFFDMEYFIEDPSDKTTFKYKNDRAKDADKPVFPDGATVTVGNVGNENVTLTIPQATDGENIHSYRFDFYANDKLDVSASIWSEFYFKNMPETLTQEFGGLVEGTDYTVKVTAIDSWGKESEKPITATFKTGGTNVPVDKTSDVPEADILQIVVGDNKATDGSRKNKTVEHKNGVKVVFDEETGRNVLDFDGNNQNLIVRYTRSEFNRVTEQVSMTLGFKLDNFASSYCNPFANMQSGGYGFEINTGSQSLEFWCSINGSYTTVSMKIEEGKYYNVAGVYDGNELSIYSEGEKVASKKVSGAITYPSVDSALAFCVGSDINGAGEGEAFFDGKVAYASVYSYALSDAQVKNICDAEK